MNIIKWIYKIYKNKDYDITSQLDFYILKYINIF